MKIKEAELKNKYSQLILLYVLSANVDMPNAISTVLEKLIETNKYEKI